uniref:Packaging ATPase n=1 Tax=Marseillevirus LCMAC202 TaxID=2506606 RepID=A0A481YY48_9VIRU|nr:MAG: packaging ATPase [Marseillevirus LCMAC202]
MEFKLEHFDVTSCKPQHSIFILGVSESGKTKLIQKIIGASHVMIYRNSVDEYKSISNSSILDDFENFPSVVDYLKQRAEAVHHISWARVVLDDVIEEPDEIMTEQKYVDRCLRWENTHVAADVLCNRMGLVLASRFMLIQRPDLRHMLGYVFIFADGIRGNRKRLHFAYQYYLNELISREVFEAYMENHQALVIDHTEGKVFWC